VLEFSLNEEIIDFLFDYEFIMFDTIYNSDNFKPKINNHSLVITKNDWKSINIIQVTDLHLAERNDQMLKKVKKMYKNKRLEISNEKLTKLTSSVEKRLINPNNLFRKFIKEMNKRVLENEIDFIFITGDIVDFSIPSYQSPHQENLFDYEKSNWKIFKDIILHMNSPTNEIIEESEELLCPIFTIPGNHDYRPWQYDLNWGGIYKKVGLKKIEAQAIKNEYSASPIKAILKSEKALNGYLTEINASLDYSLKFDKSIFIFLNSGADSYREITDFVRGNPSLTGVSKKQIKFIKNIVNFTETNNHQVILSIHGPPINTPLKRGIISRFKKLFKKSALTSIDQFKESKFKKINKKKEKVRIDNKFNINYGTVSANWEELINFCYNYCILTLSGHTHILNEYRLQRINENKNDDFSIAVFYDDYSDTCINTRKIKKKAPFIVQTPALGFRSYKKPGRVGGFREIKIKNNKLYSFKVKYL
jgi:Icc-related predicted phosphoesterase